MAETRGAGACLLPPIADSARRERWLLISYWANSPTRAPSQHIDDRLPHLHAAGIALELITSICGPRPAACGARWHRVPSLSPSGCRFEVRHAARRLPRPWGWLVKSALGVVVLPCYWLEKLALPVESTFWWWLSAGPAGLGWAMRRRPDLVYSTGGPMSAHLAAALISRALRLVWIAEIQDPLHHEARGRGRLHRWLATKVERLVHARATGVVYLTRAARDRAAARAGGAAELAAIYPGAEVRPPDHRAPGERMEIAHVGTLSGSRNAGSLLAALARLAARRPEVRHRVRLRLMGWLDRAAQGQARSFLYPEMVEAPGRVPRPAALAAMADSDLLVVIQNCDRRSEETIPSKVYEYLAAGRPVLGLTFRNPELAEMLRQAGHTSVEVDDVEGIARALETAYDRWRRGELSAEPCLRYRVEGAVAELIAWARRVRAAGAGGRSSDGT